MPKAALRPLVGIQARTSKAQGASPRGSTAALSTARTLMQPNTSLPFTPGPDPQTPLKSMQVGKEGRGAPNREVWPFRGVGESRGWTHLGGHPPTATTHLQTNSSPAL